MNPRRTPRAAWLWYLIVALSIPALVGMHLPHLRWVSELSEQGTPAPARDHDSVTGYTGEQRHFLGSYERGETYRWIAAVQNVPEPGDLGSAHSEEDALSASPSQSSSRLYAAWLAGASSLLQWVSGDPFGIAVERVALWEPVILHLLAFLGSVFFMWSRHGPGAGVAAGVFVMLFPPIFGQFLPGVLGPRTWAMLLAAYGIAVSVPRDGTGQRSTVLSLRSAVAGGLALWLDPAIGFPVVLVCAVAGAVAIYLRQTECTGLKWALTGSALALAGWLIDRNPWDPAVGELRYVHPVYAFAWLGLGLGLSAWSYQRKGGHRRSRWLAQTIAAVALMAPLAWFQIESGFKAWFYPAIALQRITALNEASLFATVFSWMGAASFGELAFVSAPILLAAGGLVYVLWRERKGNLETYHSVVIVGVVFCAVVLLTVFRVRWGVVLSLVSMPIIAHVFARSFLGGRGALAFAGVVYFALLFGWQHGAPSVSFTRPSGEVELRRADVEALVYRTFSHWLASHTPGRDVLALAPPELSGSILFHGHRRALMSTAWESYRGQLAASRLLSAQESSEAEAVVASIGVTHVILPSWDRVLPLLVRKPAEEDRDTLYERLDRWVLPAFLRPVPYHLPPVPAFREEKLAIFAVTDAQDQAIALSRLAEYFIEMNRIEPAGLVAEALESAFPDDRNAAVARALVYRETGNQAGFQNQLTRLASDVGAAHRMLWDRRVQRAIVLAIGGRGSQARDEVAVCVESATREDLFALTPLQAFRLKTLVAQFGLTFEDAGLAELLDALSSEYTPAS